MCTNRAVDVTVPMKTLEVQPSASGWCTCIPTTRNAIQDTWVDVHGSAFSESSHVTLVSRHYSSTKQCRHTAHLTELFPSVWSATARVESELQVEVRYTIYCTVPEWHRPKNRLELLTVVIISISFLSMLTMMLTVYTSAKSI